MGRAVGRHDSAPGGDGAEKETDRGAGVGFEVTVVLQVFGDQHRMAEMHQRDQHQPGGFARVDGFELPALEAFAQNRLQDHPHVFLVRADGSPAQFDRRQNDVVNTLVCKVIFLVKGDDFEHQPFDAFGRGAGRACHRPGAVFEFTQTPLADRLAVLAKPSRRNSASAVSMIRARVSSALILSCEFITRS